MRRVGEEDEEGGDEVEAVQRGPPAAESFRATRAESGMGACVRIGRDPDLDRDEGERDVGGSGVCGGLGFRVRGGYGEWPAWWPGWAAGLLGRSPRVSFPLFFVSFVFCFVSFLFIYFSFTVLLLVLFYFSFIKIITST